MNDCDEYWREAITYLIRGRFSTFYGIPGANAGKKNGMYQHGRWSKINKPPKKQCANCKATNNLLYHHINHNELDNRKKNIRILCKKCHERHHERGNNFNRKKSKNASVKRVKNGKKAREKMRE